MNWRAPFSWLDTNAQRVVDAAMFFVMRKTGWKKSFVRYALRAVCILLWVTASLSSKLGVLGIVLVGVLGPVQIFCQHLNRRTDERLEGVGLAWRLTPVRWLWWAWLLLLEPLNLAVGLPWQREAIWSALWIGELISTYSECTPPVPPARAEARRHALTLVPARSPSP